MQSSRELALDCERNTTYLGSQPENIRAALRKGCAVPIFVVFASVGGVEAVTERQERQVSRQYTQAGQGWRGGWAGGIVDLLSC